MKKVIFMRHGFLKDKYSDYSKLGFKDLENLLTKKVFPHLDKEKTRLVLTKKPFINDVDFVISSDESRAIETADIVKELINIDYIESNLLNEIGFDEGIISKKDVNLHDFNHIRRRVLTQFFNSLYSEKFEDVVSRFLDFIDYLKTLNYNTILCITHGWFMRLIYIYSVRGSLDDISLKDLLEAKIPGFLDTIGVYIK